MNLRHNLQTARNSKLLAHFFSVTFWSIFGSVISNGGGLVTLIFVARLLGQQVFGQFVALQTLVVLGTTLCWYGIGFVVTRYCAELRLRDTQRLGRILGMAFLTALSVGGLAFLSIFVFADQIATHFLNARELSPALRLVSVSIVLNAIDGFNKNALIGLSQLRAFAMGSIVSMLLYVPLMLALTHLYGLIGATFGLTLGACINAFVSHFQLRQALHSFAVKLQWTGGWNEHRLLTGFAAPGLIVAFLPNLSTFLCQIFLVKTSHGYAEVAIFGVAMQWFHIVNFLPGNVARAIMPMLTDSVIDKDRTRSHFVFFSEVGTSVLASLPIALGGFFLAPFIMRGYGSDFDGNALPVMITMLAGVMNAAQSPVQNLIAAKSEMWVAAAMASVQAFIYIFGALYMIPFGAVGVTIAFAAAYLLVSLWSLFYGWSHFYGEVKK